MTETWRYPFGQTNPAALGTASPGTSPKKSRSDHVHPAVSNQSRAVGFGPLAWSLDVGTRVTLGTVPNAVDAVQLADAATQGFSFMWKVPDDAVASSAINLVLDWANNSADASAHAVRWQLTWLVVSSLQSSMVAAGTTTLLTGASAARATVNGRNQDTFTNFAGAVSAGSLVRLNVRRLGSDAADTYVGAVNVLFALVQYVSTQ